MAPSSGLSATIPEAPLDCPLCPRLVAYRQDNDRAHPDWFNAPVPSFGTGNARLLIVGLAPGVQGANRTGRPFTGDYAGDLLYATLLEFGFARGTYDARPDDGLELVGAMITNAVRCVPPQNKPTPAEAKTCLRFLSARIEALPDLQAVLALGRIAHDAVLSARELKRSSAPFGHGAQHDLGQGLRLFDSYHCSRYNTNTRRLTPDMFRSVFSDVRAYLDGKGR
ncbi:Uracil-DNA glycosylase superfamily [Parvibaculum lavamentivorans DS-1]|uniref:Type-5 uracil-DNA glycosylase n=1 Tax=Parvibaculum lavamentivorans (strain DS-1 / DSM 13023 / NCIMB 13966) TaxID=402881 RepID=A7HX38_PARL1|nr:Uracil-DNA glycosylase superfamily [Parvibaculum lavamentivorans DS-1]